MSQSHRQTPML